MEKDHVQLLQQIATLVIRVMEHTNIYLYSTFAVEGNVSLRCFFKQNLRKWKLLPLRNLVCL